MDLLTISRQYANARAGLPSSANIIPGSTTTFGGNVSVNGSLTGQSLLIGTSSSSQCAINKAGFLQMTGTTSGTVLQLLDMGFDPYTYQGQALYDYSAIGVTAGTSLDMYTWSSYNWNIQSTKNASGFNAMRLSNYGLGVYIPPGEPQASFHVGFDARIDGSGFSQFGSPALHLGGPLTILDGANDYYRFISALDNSMSSSSRYMNMGQSTSTGNSLEMEFRFDSSNAPTNAFKFGFPGNGVMTLLNSGRVGILTSTPAATLDVSGTGRYSGSLTVGGSVTTSGLAFSGTTAGTVLQLVNATSGTTTTAYGALGVTPGTALENFAQTSHRWWTGSSGTNSGAVGMQLNSGGLMVTGTAGVTLSGTVAGTILRLINATTVTNGTTSTQAFAAIGVTPGTALENFSLNSHRWWTGSSGTTSGIVGMQLVNSGLSVATPIVNANNAYGQFTFSNQTFNGFTIPIAFTYNGGNMTLSTSTQVLIPYNGLYSIALNFETSSAAVVEIAMYVNGNPGNRLFDKFLGGSTFPESRHTYAVTALLNSGDLLSSFLSTNASMQIGSTYSRGLTIALISRNA